MHLKQLIGFSIKSLNQEEVFAKIQKAGIVIYDLNRKNRFETTFKVNKIDKKVVDQILLSFSAEIQEVKPADLYKLKKTIWGRSGICFAIIFCILLSVFSSFFVFNIRVYGTEKLSTNEIILCLQNQGIKPFCAKHLVQQKEVEAHLIKTFPEISLVSVVVKGLTVCVNIKEKSVLPSAVQSEITSAYNGRIKAITVISGTAKVQVGDIVKKGDVLVAVDTQNSNFVEAKAIITLEGWEEVVHRHYATQVEKVRTGKTVSARQIHAFGIEIFSSQNDCGYTNFETEERQIKTIGLILPIVVTQKTFFELENRIIKEDYESVKEKIIDQCKQNALQKLSSNDIIKSENVFERTEGEITYTNYVVMFETQMQ